MHIILTLTVGLTTLSLGLGCNSQNLEDRPQEKILVETAEVEKKEIRIPIHTSGNLAPASEMKLAFKTGGIISTITVKEGDKVPAGSVLAKLDISEIEAQVDLARSGFEKAQRDLSRAKKLYDDNAASFEQFQNATTAVDVARSQLRIAEFNLQHSTIIAPTMGRILRRFAEPNELVSAGMPIFYFGSLQNNWVVKTGISDQDIVRLSLGDSANVSIDAYPAKKIAAVVSKIGGAADPLTGTYPIELTIAADEPQFFAGLVAKVDITPSVSELVFVIPMEALVEADGNHGFVYTFNPSSDAAQKVPVVIAHVLENDVAISGGLEHVSRVITAGSPYLHDGSQVQP